MTPYEYRKIMEGFSYKEHLDCPSDFWHGKPDEIDKGKYLYDLKTENKYEDCFIYKRYQNGILRITNPKCNKETNLD